MRSLSRLLLLAALIAASAPSADAQLGRLVNRARAAVTGTSSSSATESSTTAVDYARLMNTRFFPNQGTFYFGTSNASGGILRGPDQVIFPPSGSSAYDEIGHYVVRRADGQVIGRQTAIHNGATNSEAFVQIGTSGGPNWSGALEHGGSYSLDLEVGGAVVGTVPFTVQVVESGDPFNPGSSMVLDGPWRTHAFFQHETDRPDYLMDFVAWVGPDEAPSNVQSEISIRRNGQEVAWGHGFTNMTYGWGMVEYDLFDAGTRDTARGFARQVTNATRWNVEDVTPGEYEILFSTDEGVFRTMTITGGDGAFTPHARSSMDHQPRSTFLTPRRMRAHNSRYIPMSMYWIAPAE